MFRLKLDYSNSMCDGLTVDIGVDNTSVLFCANYGSVTIMGSVCRECKLDIGENRE